MKILGLCGSLRQGSANGTLLAAARRRLAQHTWFDFDLATLPYFDPDRQFADDLPAEVLRLRALGTECDRIFIATPEYAHGIPGILKNALEWLFHEGTQRKPVFLVIGSAQGEFARDQLLEVLRTMDFVIDSADAILIRGARAKLSAEGQFKDSIAEAEFNELCARLESER